MLASVLNRKCGSICACSACMRASSTARSCCSESARRVASFACSSARRLPRATILMMNDTTMSTNTGAGRPRNPPSRRPRNETASSAFHEMTASQSKNDHHTTTAPLRISASACRNPIGDAVPPLAADPGVRFVPRLPVSVFIACLVGSSVDYGARVGEGGVAFQRRATRCAPAGPECGMPACPVRRRGTARPRQARDPHARARPVRTPESGIAVRPPAACGVLLFAVQHETEHNGGQRSSGSAVVVRSRYPQSCGTSRSTTPPT